MNFELSEEQLLIRESVVKLCADFPDDYWSKKDTEHEFPWDFYEAMAEAGWLGIAIPEAYGGSGRGITEASLVLEEVLRAARYEWSYLRICRSLACTLSSSMARKR